MDSMLERPSFYEGQILAGADLNAAVDHARGQAARHARFLHLWGIAEGLELKTADRKTAAGAEYKEVSVGAGMALDASGREVVVPSDTLLSEQAFDESNVWVGQPKLEPVRYPVFLTGRDSVAPAPVLAVGQCGGGEPTRLREDIQLEFGRPGEEITATEQPPTAVADGPDSGQSTPRRLLLGFVQWNADIARFTKAEASFDGIGRRYAGVRADAIAARGGSVAVRTRTAIEKGKPGLELSEAGDGLLAYGPLTAAGAVEPVFSVNAKGDLTIAGKFSGAVTPGSMQVQSGVAMDGLLLPLPPGVTREMLDKGQATAHVHVTARVPPSLPPGAGNWVACPLECAVDAELRVRCTVRWLLGAATVDLPGECDYLVVVSVAAA